MNRMQTICMGTEKEKGPRCLKGLFLNLVVLVEDLVGEAGIEPATSSL